MLKKANDKHKTVTTSLPLYLCLLPRLTSESLSIKAKKNAIINNLKNETYALCHGAFSC